MQLHCFMGDYIEDISSRSKEKFKKEIKEKTGKKTSEIRIVYETEIFNGLSRLFEERIPKWLVEETDVKKENFGLWELPEAAKSKNPVGAPLQFVVMSERREKLRMGRANNESTMKDIVLWLSKRSVCQSADAVSFFLGEFGRTSFFPLHGGPFTAHEWKEKISVKLYHRNSIPVMLRSYGRNSGSESPRRQLFRLRRQPPAAMPRTVELQDSMYMSGKRKLRTSGPIWRSVKKGLNIEGECTNYECKTKELRSCKFVFLSYGFEVFDLILHGKKYPCPSCKKPVEPKRYGLYDCLWKVVRVTRGSSEPVTDGWCNSTNEYQFFNWCPDQRDQFSRFLIFARPISDRISPKSSDPVPKDCAICFGAIERGSEYQLLCRHIFHRQCIENSADDHLEEDSDPTCVLCDQKYSPPLANAELDQALKDANVLISELQLSETQESQLKSAIDKIQRMCHENDRK